MGSLSAELSYSQAEETPKSSTHTRTIQLDSSSDPLRNESFFALVPKAANAPNWSSFNAMDSIDVFIFFSFMMNYRNVTDICLDSQIKNLTPFFLMRVILVFRCVHRRSLVKSQGSAQAAERSPQSHHQLRLWAFHRQC